MGKKKMDELPMRTVEAMVEAVEPVVTSTPMPEPEADILTITAPTIRWGDGYVRKSLDVKLTGEQAATLKSIQMGLEKQEAQLKSGRYVANPVDAIRWMLENVK